MSIIDPLIWQALGIYREEAINPENPFNEEQRAELLGIVDQAEKYSKKVKHINKYGRLLMKYDTKYKEWGGNMARLNEKIDIIYSEYGKILPGHNILKKVEDIAQSYNGTQNIKSRIKGLRR